MKENYQKPFKKLTLFFLLNPVPFKGQIYKKQKGLGTSGTSLSSGYETSSKKIIIYYHTKFGGVIWSGSWVIPKLTPANSCKPIHDIINYSTSVCSFESGKCGKEEEKLQRERN